MIQDQAQDLRSQAKDPTRKIHTLVRTYHREQRGRSCLSCSPPPPPRDCGAYKFVFATDARSATRARRAQERTYRAALHPPSFTRNAFEKWLVAQPCASSGKQFHRCGVAQRSMRAARPPRATRSTAAGAARSATPARDAPAKNPVKTKEPSCKKHIQDPRSKFQVPRFKI